MREALADLLHSIIVDLVGMHNPILSQLETLIRRADQIHFRLVQNLEKQCELLDFTRSKPFSLQKPS